MTLNPAHTDARVVQLGKTIEVAMDTASGVGERSEDVLERVLSCTHASSEASHFFLLFS